MGLDTYICPNLDCGYKNFEFESFTCPSCGTLSIKVSDNERKKITDKKGNSNTGFKKSGSRFWLRPTKPFRKSDEEIERLNNQAFETFLEEGIDAEIALPEFETVSYGGASRVAATMVGGLIGFALTSGSTTQQRKIRSFIRPAKNGIVIPNGTVEGKDLRIPWNAILSITQEEHHHYFIHLVEGNVIDFKITHPFWLDAFYNCGDGWEFEEMIFDYLSSKPCGEIDDGW